MKTIYIVFALSISTQFLGSGCRKSDFLNAKPNINLNVPASLSDFQSLMDNYDIVNQTPGMGDLSSDHYYLSAGNWQAIPMVPQNCYIWARDIFEGTGNNQDWDLSYQQVLIANIVLEGLAKLKPEDTDPNLYATVKGEALFIRAFAFFNLSQLFAKPYDSASAQNDEGIPVRLSSDVSVAVPRSSVDVTYRQIIADLNASKGLLRPALPGSSINRPVKATAYALLSRVYLSMRAYPQAGANADSSLQLYSTLMDYNSLPLHSRVCFSRFNPETTYQSYQVTLYPVKGSSGIARIDSTLYLAYDSNDLRKYAFYRVNNFGGVVLKGTYNGTFALFSGFATNEMYLNRAESAAREGDANAALSDLNLLLSHRYLSGSFQPYQGLSATDALTLILKEREKELPFSSVRWTDLRRLNLEGMNIGLSRNINGQTYNLPPGDIRYVLPIPPDEISRSGISQNPR